MTRGFEFNPDFDLHLGRLVRENLTEPWSEAVLADAHRGCPVDTGHLNESLDRDVISDYDAQIGSDLDYAAAVEVGARSHVIRSHGNYPLRNRETGQVFGREVHHPGNQPQPYLRPALYRRRFR